MRAPVSNCLQSRSEYGLMYRPKAGQGGIEQMADFALVTPFRGCLDGLPGDRVTGCKEGYSA